MMRIVRYPVYPRWRGEHGDFRNRELKIFGLSPLARGTREICEKGFHFLRFIPAGAGNTRLQEETYIEHAVYPRWRGEHLAIG